MAKVKMINGLFGNTVWVTEDRVEEYKAAGHKLAASAPAQKPQENIEEKADTPLVKELKEEKKAKRK